MVTLTSRAEAAVLASNAVSASAVFMVRSPVGKSVRVEANIALHFWALEH
jgi:hypothetical protein